MKRENASALPLKANPIPLTFKYSEDGDRFALPGGILKLNNALKSDFAGLFRAISWIGVAPLA